MKRNFSRYIQPIKCDECGRMCLPESFGGSICSQCYERAGIENEHLDYGHATPEPNCPICEKEAEGK